MDPQIPTPYPQNSQVMQPGSTQPVMPQQTGIMYAGFWRRFVAAFVDGIIVYVISLVFEIIFGILTGLLFRNMEFIVTIISGLLSLILYYGYFIYFIGNRGQTLGKMLLGIKVVKVNTNDPPGYVGAFLREVIGKFLSLILLLGYLWMLWDEKKQTWHDKIAGTVVIRV